MSSPIAVAAVCFGAVMVSMTLLTAILFLLRSLRRPAPGALDPAGVDPELLAVLAAAATAALGRPVSIHRVHVRPLPSQEAWSRAGRMDIMVSHRVEPKR